MSARLVILSGLVIAALAACGTPEEATPDLTERAEITELHRASTATGIDDPYLWLEEASEAEFGAVLRPFSRTF